MRRLIYITLSLLIISGCSSTPDSGSDQAVSTDPLTSKSQVFDVLDDMDNTEKLLLANQYIKNQNFVSTQLVVDAINFELLNPAQQTEYGLIIVELYVRSGRTNEALIWLNGNRSFVFDNLTRKNQIQVSQWRATAWEYSGQFLAATRERIFISPILTPEQQLINHELIWADLQFLSLEDLLRLSQINDGSDLSGWAALAYTNIMSGKDLELQVEAISKWQISHKGHPAANSLPGGLDTLKALVLERPTHIGILLPLSGPLKNSGEAIMNGFMTAYYEASTTNRTIPKVTFVDTHKISDPDKAYEQLVRAGAQLVVGPLEKKKVRKLQQSPKLPIPVMALNTSDRNTDIQSGFYQFGLSPEDEATQVAIRAHHQGFYRAAILVPSNSWGDRIYQTFKSQFNQTGGDVVSLVKYENAANRELLQVVRKLLNLDASIKRTEVVESIIGDNVEYEPRRRKDIDFIFIAAMPSEARQIKPLLDFQYASDIPVFGISTIYSGKTAPDLDKDIENVQFLDMPWQIQAPKLKTQAYKVFGEQNVTPYNRLYAMGADIFQLYPRLKQLNSNSTSRIHGYTGVLSMDAQGRIKRELSWAIISKGIAVPSYLEIDAEKQ